jgi:hypothetical protein
MRELPAHLELVIKDADVDADWQLIDVEAALAPYHEQIRAIDAQLVAVFEGNK